MVDIFQKEICNYCKNTQCKKNNYNNNEIIEIEKDKVITYKCINYKKDLSKIIPIEPPLSITAKRDYINYHQI